LRGGLRVSLYSQDLKERIMATKKKKKVTEKEKVAVEPKLKPVPKRIRVLFSGANKDRAFIAGKTYRVPEEVPEDSARNWLASGKAEEDKSGKEPAETK
jgi:hypothetical protein